MNWRILFLPVAVLVETAAVTITKLTTGTAHECGLGDWVFDRRVGDPIGKPFQTRREAQLDHERKP